MASLTSSLVPIPASSAFQYVPAIDPLAFTQAVGVMQKIAKVECHLHLGGSWPLSFLREASADRPHLIEALNSALEELSRTTSYHAVFDFFSALKKIVNSEELVEKGVYALCQELAKDNVTHVEIRTSLKDVGNGFAAYLEAVLRGMQKGMRDFAIHAGLLLSFQRSDDKEMAQTTLNLALANRSRGVVGLDLSGDSTKGDGVFARTALQEARRQGLFSTIHIGEVPLETLQQQLTELQEIQPKRVGHCVSLHPQVRDMIYKEKIPVELCLTSATTVRMMEAASCAGMLEKGRPHPALEMLQKGHPVIICTDDPTMFKCSLTEECARVMLACGFSVEKMKSLQSLALEHSFLT